MSDYDSNYEHKLCPFCRVRIGANKDPDGLWVYDLEDEGVDFFQCHKCDNFFKASLDVHKEYNYYIYEPTDEEIKEHGLIANKGTEEDCPGQTFIWNNLFFDKS